MEHSQYKKLAVLFVDSGYEQRMKTTWQNSTKFQASDSAGGERGKKDFGCSISDLSILLLQSLKGKSARTKKVKTSNL